MSDNESEISTLTPSQEDDSKKGDGSADEPDEEHGFFKYFHITIKSKKLQQKIYPMIMPIVW